MRLNDQKNMPIALIMADINNLKITNDTIGHQMGDQLIITFANILKSICRSDDVVSRTGGDEFVILLPDTNFAAASKILERISEAITAFKHEYFSISVSFGIVIKETVEQKFTDLFKQAERYMYLEKESYRKKLTQ